MIQISLTEAVTFLESCSAVIVNDGALIYPILADLTGVPDNEFMLLSWDEDGEEYYIHVVEENNPMVTIEGGSLIFLDQEGDEFKLTLLKTMVIS